jgi:hypothetical protein
MAALIAAGTLAGSASAQQPAQPGANQQAPIEVNGKKTPDLNQVVCEKEQDTGSRLMSHKVCMTRGEWNEQRRLQRMDIDKAQIQRPMGG